MPTLLLLVCVSRGAAPAEVSAAHDLSRVMKQVTGTEYPVTICSELPAHGFVIATDATLASDEVRVRSRGDRVEISGGTPAATVNAVYTFLQDAAGVRWWAPWAETIPQRASRDLRTLDLRQRPAFSWRDDAWRGERDEAWARRNRVNGTLMTAGEHLQYAGFVHTFYALVPPKELFASHPEWFSLIGGKRQSHHAQLCLANEQLRQFAADRLKELLRRTPDAQIASVSQNDYVGGFCECDRCRALYARFGTKSGALVDFVNAIASAVHRDFPHVLVDTLVYQETRRPPNGIVAAPNVAIRLACIECPQSAPLADDAAYMADLSGWRAITKHLFIWDYPTNWSEYLMPVPNWFVLQKNLALFQRFGAEGVFEEGVYDSYGGEFSELRAWMLARLLWNPQQDGNALIDEFLSGYYGAAAAKPIRESFDVLAAAHSVAKYEPLRRAELLWQAAESASAGDADHLWRIRQGHQWLRYAWLTRWAALRNESRTSSMPWPLSASRMEVAREFLHVATLPGPPGWHPTVSLEEIPRLTVADFASRLSVEAVSERERAAPPKSARRSFSLPMPAGAIAASAMIVAVAWLASRRRRILLFAAALVIAAIAILAMRTPALTFRYAVAILACCIVAAVVASLFVRRAWAIGAIAIVVAIVALPFASYAKVRLLRRYTGEMTSSRLAGANLNAAILDGANLSHSDLYRATAAGSMLNYANLDGSDLRQANLTGAMLAYTTLRDADLRGADLRHAIVIDLTRTAFRGARVDASTKLPEGIDPEAWDMIRD